MPDQDADQTDFDQWWSNFTSSLNDLVNQIGPRTPPPSGPGLLGSAEDIAAIARQMKGQSQGAGGQGLSLGVTGLPTAPEVGQVATDNQGTRQYFVGYDQGGNQVWNPMGFISNGPNDPGVTEIDPVVVTGHTPHPALADIAGKAWGLPNTALGLGLAGAAWIAGKIAGTNPQFHFGNNALQLTGSPLTLEKGGTVTLGNVQVFGAGANPDGPGRNYVPALGDIPLRKHEEAHTYQSQILGPFYVPLWGLLGGESAGNPLERAADWYGAGQGGPFSHMWPFDSPKAPSGR